MYSLILVKSKQIFLACLSILWFSFTSHAQDNASLPAAHHTEDYLPYLKGFSIGVVSNQTSNIGTTHLVDSLVSSGINIKTVFAPEHGFRGNIDAGEYVKDGKDSKTGLPIISLYGKNKKPKPEQIEDIDILVFDIQDVGARFYTYLSTLHYIMEAAAEANIKVIVLDRPNPNAHYIDGPILKTENSSFIGLHPVPIVYGMTIGEYAKMINGEGWLQNEQKCDLQVIPLKNYNRNTTYELPVRPSPNLPNAQSIALYPSLCLFEGTPVSAGRGTEQQFQIFGSPDLDSEMYSYTFTPQANLGAKYPKFKGELCFGENLSAYTAPNQIELQWLINAYKQYNKDSFFTPFFDKLAGNTELKKKIISGMSAEKIRESWKSDLQDFQVIRSKYLIYP
jgi:uncharacterized protein YbbC (DUF1343 family)